ncbi:1-phosphofructokinase [Sansalvadorimonas sp. 2012CJ34-2]|uniref:Phosphofructokinase n=1 Tax=Parendozoicomonas callyspongiae TaxID=2942213 RepID=A0ABT0PIR7_9GAMM|nr:1-phosphofructokinase [Sansalvadorimonas sp. 2012CJ34-2]MCL6271255.1 1-phosphofructokinase [Sansalvadorimonas sp. 2012CJ34-2]
MNEVSKPILAVTLNPALDLTIQCDILNLDAVNIASSGNLRAAGKGINVAKVLTDLGKQVSVTGILGEKNREKFDAFFKEHLITNKCLYVEGETRINVKLAETNDQVTEINLPGMPLDSKHIEQFTQRLIQASRKSDWVVLSGSLPKSAPKNLYYLLTKTLKQQGARVVLDTSGEALRKAIKAVPFLVKPNIHELEQWCNHSITSSEQEAEVVAELLALGTQHVVVSHGRKGCRWYTKKQVWEALPLDSELVSTVGAGDSMVAGLVYGLSNGWSNEATLKLATAVAAQAVSQVGVGIADIHRLSALRKLVVVNEFEAITA